MDGRMLRAFCMAAGRASNACLSRVLGDGNGECGGIILSILVAKTIGAASVSFWMKTIPTG